MISLSDIVVLLGMFVVRIGIPLGVVLLLGYFLKRLDRRWEAEARAERAAAAAAEQPAAQPAAPRPVRRSGVDIPGPQLPFEPVPLRIPQPGLVLIDGRHCWDVKGCSEQSKAKCPATQHPDMPCWQARMESEGRMPDACPDCDIFQRYPLM
jgi:hypothetical protein